MIENPVIQFDELYLFTGIWYSQYVASNIYIYIIILYLYFLIKIFMLKHILDRVSLEHRESEKKFAAAI